MNWSQVEFCQSVGGCRIDRSSLAQEISTELFSAPSQFADCLVRRYEVMASSLGIVPSDATIHNWDQNGLICRFDESRPDVRLPIPSSFVQSLDDRVRRLFGVKCFGFDLPIWIKNPGDVDKRIMLITQDPRRKDDPAGEVTVSSPFGMHSARCRENTIGNTMTQVVEMLCDMNCAVYLTDAAKFYSVESGRSVVKSLSLRFSDFLVDEIGLFDPTHIVAFGKDAVSTLLNVKVRNFADRVLHNNRILASYCDRPLLALAHISRRNVARINAANWNFAEYFETNIREFVIGAYHE